MSIYTPKDTDVIKGILLLFVAGRKSYTAKQIINQITRKYKLNKTGFVKRTLNRMTNDTLIESKKEYRLASPPSTLTATIVHKKKRKFELLSDEIEGAIPTTLTLAECYLHGDEVNVHLFYHRGRDKVTPIITSLISRTYTQIVGRVEKKREQLLLVPDNHHIHAFIEIPHREMGKAKPNDKVVVEIKKWEPYARPVGHVVRVMGSSGEHLAEIESIMAQYKLSTTFSKKVIRSLDQSVNKATTELPRTDYRSVFTITIDPVDARDYDDGLSFVKLEEGVYEIGIHIADVAHYVKAGTALDKEALHRGTSVYLPDRVVPMLPEKLSNDVCSLVPYEDRLAFAVIIQINADAKIITTRFEKTLIHSDARLTYEQVQEMIEDRESSTTDVRLKKTIRTLHHLAQKLREIRFIEGGFSFAKAEVKFNFDKQRNPVSFTVKNQRASHQLIEEFMLVANREVSSFLSKGDKRHSPLSYAVYRIHDLPDEEKLQELRRFAKDMGVVIHTQNQREFTKSVQALHTLSSLDPHERDVIDRMIIRAMSKAAYSTKNIGHYGLGFNYYTHFTSPIRRYPDIIAHRLLEQALIRHSKKIPQQDAAEDMCVHCSRMERLAISAEREATKVIQIKYMQSKIGETFRGVISGVVEWGLYVEISENLCEGLVKRKAMKDDEYRYDARNNRLQGLSTKVEYVFGQKVEVKVVRADVSMRQLDLELINV